MKETLRFNFGRQIKTFRLKLKLTQEELAAFAQIDCKYLQKIEGKNPPNVSLKIIERLAIALKITPQKLFDY